MGPFMKPGNVHLLKRAFLLALVLSLSSMGIWEVPVYATITSVTLVEDAVIPSDNSARDNNYGSMTSLHVGSVTTTYTSTRRSLIRFKDIASSLGANQVIISATMYLYCHQEQSATNYAVSAYRVLLNWGEGNSNGTPEVGAVCTNDAQYDGDAGGIPWNAVGCDAASDGAGEDSTADRGATPEASTVITGTGWFSWDLTTAVKKWYSGEWSEYGLILISNSEGAGYNSLKQFASSENTPAPYLEVTHYTEGVGLTLEVCGTGCDYTTIQAALADATPGDTVKVMDGATYTSSAGNLILMKTGVDLVSDVGVTPTINGIYRPAVSFEGPLTNCTLDGFTITGGLVGSGGQINMEGTAGPVTEVTIQNCFIDGSSGASVGPAIRLAGAVAFTVRDCQLVNCNASCIVTPPGNQTVAYTGFPIRIEGCEIQASAPSGLGGAGVRIIGDGTSGVEVIIGGDGAKTNHIHDCPLAGIRLDNFGTGSAVTIDNNVIEANGSGHPNAGIDIESVASATITRNIIRNNGKAGIAINPGTVAQNQNLTIGGSLAEGNEIYSNDWAGISFGGRQGPVYGTFTIQGNNIYSNARGGIFLKSRVNGKITVSQNEIHDNTRGGLAVKDNCELEITKNNIRNNGRGGIHTGEGNNFAGTLGGALLTIRQNEIHHHQNATRGGGIDVRHASGAIENNLVYRNSRGGIRFGDYISEIKNNTVVNNGDETQDRGGGIIYDDPAIGTLNDPPDGTLKDSPNYPYPLIRNNITAYNEKAGLRVGGNGYDCPDNPVYSGDAVNYRDYNLLYANYPWNDVFSRPNPEDCGWPGLNDMSCTKQQYGGCGAYFDSGIVLDNPNDVMANPLFQDMASDNYNLTSPLGYPGDDGSQRGAYGGDDPLVDSEIPHF
jgi:hypothetical protein